MKGINNGRRMEVERGPQWQVAIESAIKSAISLEEAERRDEEINRTTSDFLNGAIDADAYRRIDEKYQSDTRGHATFTDIETYREAMVWLLKKLHAGYDRGQYIEKANTLIEHEEEHYQEALAQGLKDVKFLLRFFRDENSGVSFRPAIMFDLPKDLSDQQLKDLLRSIIAAPDELSDADEMMQS